MSVASSSGAVASPACSAILVSRDGGSRLIGLIKNLLRDIGDGGEVVLVDDASRESPRVRLEGLVGPRLTLVENSRSLGIAESRNIGMSVARGRILFVVDGDDEYPSIRWGLQAGFLSSHPDIAAVGGFAEAVDEEGNLLTVLKSGLSAPDIRKALGRKAPLIHGTLAVRKEAALSVGYRPKFAIASDMDFLFRLVEQFDAAALEVVLCRYRITPSSISVRAPAVAREAISAAKRFHYRRLAGEEEGYAAWVPNAPPLADPCSSAARLGYHLLAGKLAMGGENFDLARSHFRNAGARAMPLLALSALGGRPYSYLRRLIGSE